MEYQKIILGIVLVVGIVFLAKYLGLLVIIAPGTDATYYSSYEWGSDGKSLTLANPTLGGYYYGHFYGDQIATHLWGQYASTQVNFCYLGKTVPGSPGVCEEEAKQQTYFQNFVNNSGCRVLGTLTACFEGEGCLATGKYAVNGTAIMYRGIPACKIDLNSQDYLEHIIQGSELWNNWFVPGRIAGWNRLYVSQGLVYFYPKPVAPVECSSGQEKCENTDYYLCENDKWVNKGVMIGKCGVDCISDIECPADGYIGSKYCSLNNAAQKWRDYGCSLNKCSYQETERIIESCAYGCVNGVCKSIPEPPPTPVPVWKSVIIKILDWIGKIFEFFGLAITGPVEVEVGSLQVYNIDLTAGIPDSDYSDGSYQIQYGSWSMVDKSGNIIKEGAFEKINGKYVKSVSITVPSNPGNYAVVGIIYQYDMRYENNQWRIISEGVVVKEGLNVATKIPAPPEPKPIWSGIIDLLKSIWDWFKGWFK